MKDDLNRISILFKKVGLIIICGISITAHSQKKNYPISPDHINYEAYKADEVKMNRTIDSLLGIMTLTEKLGQLNLPSS